MIVHPFRALMTKELIHHRSAFIGLAVLIAINFLVLFAEAATEARLLTMFQISGFFLAFTVPLLALILGNRLVVSEYYGRTQLFIEALPIPRWQMVTVKYLLGLAILAGAMALNLALVALAASRTEPVELDFMLRLFVRALAFIFFVWSTAFAMGFVGRWRFIIYFCSALALSYLEFATQVRLAEVGPFKLANPDVFGLERYALPAEAIIVTTAIGAFFLAVSFLLALIREGSVVEVLARPMSRREKTISVVLAFAYITALETLDARSEKEPFEFTEDEVVRSEDLPIAIMYGDSYNRERAEALLDHLESVLGSLREAMRLDRLPPVRIAYFGVLDGDIYQDGHAQGNDGILERVNFNSERWHDADFSADLIHSVLAHTTHGRGVFEPKHWLLDGFCYWWAVEQSPATKQSTLTRRYMLRALFGTRDRPLDAKQLHRWTVYQEALGDAVSTAVAYSGLKFLQEQRGSETVMQLARSVLARRPPNDIRELFYERRHPMAEVFQEATGESWSQFIESWSNWLKRQSAPQTELGKALAQIPRISASIERERNAHGIHELFYGIQFDPPIEDNRTCTLIHAELSPYDFWVMKNRFKRRERPCRDAAAGPVRFPGLYGEGQRAFVALEVDSTLLACRVRAAAERMEFDR